MLTANMHEAKSNLSSLVARACAGEEVIIARAGKPLARIVPIEQAVEERPLGRLQGRIHMAEDFDQTPQEVLDAFYGVASE